MYRTAINEFIKWKLSKRRRFLSLLSLAMLSISSLAQIETKDSLTFSTNLPDSLLLKEISNSKPGSVTTSVSQSIYNPNITTVDQLFHYRQLHPLKLNVPDLTFTPGQTRFFYWGSGEIVASGGVQRFPGLMQVESGAIGIYQNVGNLTFYVGGIANKYGYFRGLHTQYGIDGSISYQMASGLSFTAFGEYYFGQPPHMANSMPMPPSMIGYYGRSKFGGYLDYQINERWGVQTGIQTVQQFGTNRYEKEPIVTPYYRISKKVAIGLPIGQIIYHILKK